MKMIQHETTEMMHIEEIFGRIEQFSSGKVELSSQKQTKQQQNKKKKKKKKLW